MATTIHTRLCKSLGIDAPVFAAPMGFLTGPNLAAAVSNAGGLGIMSFSANPPPVLREEIRRLRSLTNNPFGVNVLLSGPHLPFSVEAIVDVCLDRYAWSLAFAISLSSFVCPCRSSGAPYKVCGSSRFVTLNAT